MIYLYLQSILQSIIDIFNYLSKFDAIIAVIVGSLIAIKTFRFQSVHTKRLLIIEEAYAKIQIASISFKSLLKPLQNAGELIEEEKKKIFAENADDMLNFLNIKKIFFTTKEQIQIEVITNKFLQTWGDYQYRKIIEEDQSLIKTKIELFQKNWENAEKEIPELIKELELNFKETLSLK